MPEVLNLLTAYQLATYLVPGVVFGYMAENWLGYQLITQQFLANTVLCFFLGLVVSRVGSLFFQPILEWMKVVKRTPNDEYVPASPADPQLEVHLEINNAYRTYFSAFVLLLALKAFALLEASFPGLTEWSPALLLAFLALLFLLSYQKQTAYVVKRKGQTR